VILGRPDRGDDGVGPAVAERLTDLPVRYVEDPTRLVDILPGHGTVAVVDAVVSGAEPGTVLVVDVTRRPLAATWTTSSHTVGLAAGLELVRTLGAMPERLLVVGVEAATFDAEAGMSPEVVDALPIAAAVVGALVG